MDPSHRHLMEVVGVVADPRNSSLDQTPVPEFYIPFEQMPPSLWGAIQASMVIAARTAPTSPFPGTIVRAIRRAVDSVDPSLPIADIATMDDVVKTSRAQARFNTLLLSVFGVVALLLASVGVYGVVAYAVRQRTREIALRMALGATGTGVAALLVRRALIPVGLGAAVGIALAAATSRLLRDQLYGVAPGDLTTMSAVTTLLLIVSLAAVCIPAWRAMRISPARALVD